MDIYPTWTMPLYISYQQKQQIGFSEKNQMHYQVSKPKISEIFDIHLFVIFKKLFKVKLKRKLLKVHKHHTTALFGSKRCLRDRHSRGLFSAVTD